MTIGDAPKASGLPTKTIRYCESTGLMRTLSRGASGYRTYGEADVDTLRFLRRTRDLGFSIALTWELLSLWQDHSRDSAVVKTIALTHVAALRETIAGLSRIVEVPNVLADACDGDERPSCPIMDGLAAVTL